MNVAAFHKSRCEFQRKQTNQWLKVEIKMFPM